jgi:DNA primase
LFQRLNGILSPEDFQDPLCQKIAGLLFDGYQSGHPVSPAKVLDDFDDAEEQKMAAALFHARLPENISDEEVDKTVTEAIVRIKQNKLDQMIRNAKSQEDINKIIELKKQLQIFKLPAS